MDDQVVGDEVCLSWYAEIVDLSVSLRNDTDNLIPVYVPFCQGTETGIWKDVGDRDHRRSAQRSIVPPVLELDAGPPGNRGEAGIPCRYSKLLPEQRAGRDRIAVRGGTGCHLQCGDLHTGSLSAC